VRARSGCALWCCDEAWWLEDDGWLLNLVGVGVGYGWKPETGWTWIWDLYFGFRCAMEETWEHGIGAEDEGSWYFVGASVLVGCLLAHFGWLR